MTNATQPKNACILGIGGALPSRVLDNSYFESIVDTTDEWIRERTGIVQRHFAADDQLNSDLSAEAGLKALKDAGMTPDDIDVVIQATCTPDRSIPSCAMAVQDKIGARNAAGFDINAACSGFIYGLNIANALIVSQQARHILLIGTELLSRVIDMTDRTTCVLFGDGSGAVVLGGSDGSRGILGHYMRSDGALRDLITIPCGGTELPPTPERLAEHLHYVHMRGNETYKHAVTRLADSSREAISAAGLAPGDIDLVIPHQANTRILQSVAKRLGIDYDTKFFINLPHIGNTSSASIPIALNEARETGRLQPGMTILLVAFGGGLTWGGSVIRY
ncbi:ketoacyl-ACP synthase III [bacterium]|nr:ketoacyl-ACP synthase III [candidate division CSSED10-310 bacterium]